MVASLEAPQNSASARLRGSKNPTTGLHFLAKASRSALVSWTATELRPCWAGAKAAAEAARARTETAVFILIKVFDRKCELAHCASDGAGVTFSSSSVGTLQHLLKKGSLSLQAYDDARGKRLGQMATGHSRLGNRPPMQRM